MNENVLNNNILASVARAAPAPVMKAIQAASQKTGVDFAYLVQQAAAESSFNARAKAKTSSATGLYQFIESTWLSMVKKHGHKYGLDHLASKIGDRGSVTSSSVKKEILSLREDPELASLLAAELASDNKSFLERHVGGKIGATELYFAHFMGASGATGFLNALKENPLQTAADLFPREARANYNVFYDRKTGEARTLAGVYDYFAAKFGSDKIAASEPGMKTTSQGKGNSRKHSPEIELMSQMMVHNRMSLNVLQASSSTEAPSLFSRHLGLMVNPVDILEIHQMMDHYSGPDKEDNKYI
jgi:hypothetical protein